MSYDGELIIGLMTDIGLVRDPHFILAEITRGLDELTGAGAALASVALGSGP